MKQGVVPTSNGMPATSSATAVCSASRVAHRATSGGERLAVGRLGDRDVIATRSSRLAPGSSVQRLVAGAALLVGCVCFRVLLPLLLARLASPIRLLPAVDGAAGNLTHLRGLLG